MACRKVFYYGVGVGGSNEALVVFEVGNKVAAARAVELAENIV